VWPSSCSPASSVSPSPTNEGAEHALNEALSRVTDGPHLKPRFHQHLVERSQSGGPTIFEKALQALSVAGYDEQGCETLDALTDVVRRATSCLRAGL
jgi:hypothetical protein